MDRGCRYFEFYQKLGYYFVYGHTLATDGLSSLTHDDTLYLYQNQRRFGMRLREFQTIINDWSDGICAELDL